LCFLCPIILGLPGDALLLRVAWIDRPDFGTRRADDSVSLAKSSARTFSLRQLKVWSKALTTNPQRTVHKEDAQE